MTRLVPINAHDYEVLRDLANAAETTDAVTQDEVDALYRIVSAYESAKEIKLEAKK